MTFKKIYLAMVTSTLLMSASSVYSAEDGLMGTDSAGSTGNFDITLFQNAQTRVFGLQDINIDTDDSTTQTYNFCVYSNTQFARFEVSSNNAATDEAFRLTSGLGGTLPYTLSLDQLGGSDPVQWGDGGLSSGDLSIKRFGATGTGPVDNSTECSAFGENVTVTVVVDDANVTDPGAYSDQVTFTVTAI